MRRALLNQRLGFLWLLGLLALVTACLVLALDREAAWTLFQESELYENGTVVGYGLAIVAVLVWAEAGWPFRLHVASVLGVLAARELDLHKAFTSESTLRLSYYTSDLDPLDTRIVAGILVGGAHLLLIAMVIHGPRLWRALRAGAPHAYSALFAVGFLPLSKVLDKAPGLIREGLGYELTQAQFRPFRMAEETVELAVPLLVVLAVAQARVWSVRHAGGQLTSRRPAAKT